MKQLTYIMVKPEFAENPEIIELVKKESIFEDNELIEIAGYRMRSVLDSVLKDVDLNSIKTYGAFIDQGYIMTSEVVYSCDVSEPREFFLNEK